MDAQERLAIANHQVDFLREWLAEDGTQALVCGTVQDLLAEVDERPLDALVDAAAVERAIVGAFDETVRRELVGPLARALVEVVVDRVAGRSDGLGEVVGARAVERLRELVGRADVLEPELVRAALVAPEAEAIMRDVLFDALRTFNDRVNPFFAEWGLPALVAAVPLGKRALEKGLEQVRREFDRRLEPEMKRFLERFAGRSLERLAAMLVDRAAEPEMVALRGHLTQVVLDASLGQLTWPAADPRGKLVVEAIGHAIDGVLQHPATRAEVAAVWEEMWGEVGGERVGALRERLGVAWPPVDDVVAAAWPGVIQALSGEAIGAPLRDLLARSLEGWSGLD